jgi:hypothetical protein
MWMLIGSAPTLFAMYGFAAVFNNGKAGLALNSIVAGWIGALAALIYFNPF